jgi:hypothetical protein
LIELVMGYHDELEKLNTEREQLEDQLLPVVLAITRRLYTPKTEQSQACMNNLIAILMLYENFMRTGGPRRIILADDPGDSTEMLHLLRD